MYESPVRHGTAAFHTGSKLFAYSFLFGLAPWRFLLTGNCSPIVSCPPWLHGFPYRQETVREGFPIRLGSMVFLTHGKLFAYSFLFGLAPWRFLPTGNCSRRVSYSAWLHAVACPQETVGERFPVRLDSTVFLTHRKLFAKGFLYDMAPWCFLPAGNCSPIVSCPPWLHGVLYRQETVGERFPVRLDSTVFLTHRKLFAKGFLYDMAPWCFLPAGNCSPIVSCPPWLHGVLYRQETVGERFPVRLDSTVFLTHRKLFAYSFLFGLAPWCFLPAGNCLRRVSHSAWLHAVACPQETVCERFPVRLDSMVFLTHRKLFAKEISRLRSK